MESNILKTITSSITCFVSKFLCCSSRIIKVALAHPAASNGVCSRSAPNSVKGDNNLEQFSLSRVNNRKMELRNYIINGYWGSFHPRSKLAGIRLKQILSKLQTCSEEIFYF